MQGNSQNIYRTLSKSLALIRNHRQIGVFVGPNLQSSHSCAILRP